MTTTDTPLEFWQDGFSHDLARAKALGALVAVAKTISPSVGQTSIGIDSKYAVRVQVSHEEALRLAEYWNARLIGATPVKDTVQNEWRFRADGHDVSLWSVVQGPVIL